MHRYFGNMMRTSYFFLSKYFGGEPVTSARPPVLIKGTASEATNNIFFHVINPPNPEILRNLKNIITLFFALKALIHFVFQPDTVCDQRDKFRVCRLSFAIVNGIAKHLINRIHLTSAPCHLNCMTDGTLHAA